MVHLVPIRDIKVLNQTDSRLAVLLQRMSRCQCALPSSSQYCCRRFTFLAVACSKVAWPHPQSACARSDLANGLTFRCPSAMAFLMHCAAFSRSLSELERPCCVLGRAAVDVSQAPSGLRFETKQCKSCGRQPFVATGCVNTNRNTSAVSQSSMPAVH